MLPYVGCIVIIRTTISFNFFKKNNLTIKISSSLNADYITDKKKLLWCFVCFEFKYFPLYHPRFNQFIQ